MRATQKFASLSPPQIAPFLSRCLSLRSRWKELQIYETRLEARNFSPIGMRPAKVELFNFIAKRNLLKDILSGCNALSLYI